MTVVRARAIGSKATQVGHFLVAKIEPTGTGHFFLPRPNFWTVMHTENVAGGANCGLPKCKGGGEVYTMY